MHFSCNRGNCEKDVVYTIVHKDEKIFSCKNHIKYNIKLHKDWLSYTKIYGYGSTEHIEYDNPLLKSKHNNMDDGIIVTKRRRSYSFYIPKITPKLIYESDKIKKICIFCQENFNDEDLAYRLTKCEHIFHKKCLFDWTISYKQDNCPLCREKIAMLKLI